MINTNIYIIGLPGAGKTTIGKALAKMTGLRLIDTDEMIEKTTDMSINEIFNSFGEKYFRNIESEIFENIKSEENAVVSTGGGIILSENNRNIIKERGVCLYLKRDVQTILKYIKCEQRPLVRNRNDLNKLFSEREGIYENTSDIKYSLKEWGDDFIKHISQMLICINNFTNKNGQKTLAVIGCPIEHSLSPLIHNTFYRTNNIDALYIPISAGENETENFLEYAKKNLYGFNATMPHKETLVPFMDKTINADRSINTVKCENGNFSATTTDGQGFMHAIKYMDVSGKNVIILGSGGSAGSIERQLSKHKARVSIVSRNTNDAKKKYKRVYSYNELANIIKKCDMLVNATPLGMSGFGNFDNLSFIDNMPKTSIVFDTVYSPNNTSLIAHAKSIDLTTIHGIDMLIGQALYAHKFWFDKMPYDTDAVENSLKKYL